MGFLASVLAVIVVIGGVVWGAMALSWHGDHVDCLRLHEQTGYQTHMVGTMVGGECYINIDDKWIPATRYRMVDTDGN